MTFVGSLKDLSATLQLTPNLALLHSPSLTFSSVCLPFPTSESALPLTPLPGQTQDTHRATSKDRYFL